MKRHSSQECILIGQPPPIFHYTMCLTSVQHMEPVYKSLWNLFTGTANTTNGHPAAVQNEKQTFKANMIANLSFMSCPYFHGDATDEALMHNISGLPIDTT